MSGVIHRYSFVQLLVVQTSRSRAIHMAPVSAVRLNLRPMLRRSIVKSPQVVASRVLVTSSMCTYHWFVRTPQMSATEKVSIRRYE